MESLASYVAYAFITNRLLFGSKIGTLLELTETTAARIYRTQHNSEKPKVLDRTLCRAAEYVANVMEQLTVVLFDFH